VSSKQQKIHFVRKKCVRLHFYRLEALSRSKRRLNYSVYNNVLRSLGKHSVVATQEPLHGTTKVQESTNSKGAAPTEST